jgi:hypothetical protein
MWMNNKMDNFKVQLNDFELFENFQFLIFQKNGGILVRFYVFTEGSVL